MLVIVLSCLNCFQTPTLAQTNTANGGDPTQPNYLSCLCSKKQRKPSRQKGQPIRLINVNCQSISSKGGAWKNLLDSYKPDIIIATETWLHKGVGDAELEMENYQIYRRDRETGHGGGLLIAVCKSLDST